MLTVLSKVWDSVSGGLSERFLARIFGPAIFFWAGGLFFIFRSDGKGVQEIESQLRAIDLPEGVAWAVIGILLLLASNAIAEALQFTTLRVLEGYWPTFFETILAWRVGTVVGKLQQDRDEWKALAQRYTTHSREERRRYRRLDRKLAYYPCQEHQTMPTLLGNVLATAEAYGWERYGLASVVMWPRLWLVMDEGSRTEINGARGRLNLCVQYFFWSVMFLVWLFWSWWAIPIALLGTFISYRLATSAANGYGELMKSAFDVHHRTLLQRVGLAKDDEGFLPYERGRKFTMFVRRNIRPV